MRNAVRLIPMMVIAVAIVLIDVRAQSDIMHIIRQKYNAETTIESDISVTVYWKVREKEESKNGRIYLAPGDKFRVELDNTVWICDGQTYWQYSSRTSQVIIKHLLDVDLSSHPSEILSTYLTDYVYRVKEQDERKAVLVWQADSTGKASFYNSITLFVDKKKDVVSKVFVVDKHGNETTYSFKKTRMGRPIPPQIFEFDIPKGARVLDVRE